ncbi:tRNA pseudouridine(55) synthase TruB [Agromyces larvae]|uniref:tRNA pseudouridine synthase B n=1 Tax=Agromyces larvae TaxID=2929802 RepID=A0ABY4C3Y4_9MICO|nr:tRNA pseudouridine(55) synthase TruB [Agromyces larvae]
MTSHDVVARVRRFAATRKVGHAGTLDPMATGLLLIGVNSATRLLHHLVGLDKEYLATVRLGAATTTDDAEGEVVGRAPADAVAAIGDDAIREGMLRLTGVLDQVPSSVSAVKVDGRRAYDRVRDGEQVELAARRVTVAAFDLLEQCRVDGFIDLDVRVVCSSGTYVRALARDLGGALGVGGHLTALRRTRVGGFEIADATTLASLEADGVAAALMSPADAAARALPAVAVSPDEARDLGHGKRLVAPAQATGTLAAVEGDRLVAIVERRGDTLKVVTGFPQEQP